MRITSGTYLPAPTDRSRVSGAARDVMSARIRDDASIGPRDQRQGASLLGRRWLAGRRGRPPVDHRRPCVRCTLTSNGASSRL